MHWGGLGGDPERVFKIGEFTKRPFEFSNSVHISVTFEVDLDLQVIDRQVYNILDWIGDVGGLGEGCFFISYTILGIIHFGALDNMIISELFDKDGDLMNIPYVDIFHYLMALANVLITKGSAIIHL